MPPNPLTFRDGGAPWSFHFVRLLRHPLTLLFLAGLLLFVALKLHQYYNYHLGGELSDFEARLWNTLRGSFLARTPDEPSFFRDHFSPMLLLLLPAYALFQSPLTLLTLQALAAAGAVIPLYFLTRTVLAGKLAPVAFVLIYLFSRVLNYGLMYEFHMEIFYPLFFLTVFWAYETRRWRVLLLALGLALSVKEDAAIPGAAFGLYLVVNGQRRMGLAIFLACSAWFAAAMGIVIPLFRQEDGRFYGFLHYWSGYGSDAREIAANMLNPLTHIKVIFTPFKLSKMFNLFSVFLFLPLINWRRFLFLVLPNWFILYSSDNRLMNGTMLYYGLLITPFLFYATLLNLRGLEHATWPRRIKLVTVLIGVIVLVNLANSRLFKQLNPRYWSIAERCATAGRLIERLPSQEPVSAQIHLLPHIPARPYKFVLPWGLEKSLHLLFDTEGISWPMSAERNAALLDSLRQQNVWGVVEAADGYVLLRRQAPQVDR